jgi:hypothetical protein
LIPLNYCNRWFIAKFFFLKEKAPACWPGLSFCPYVYFS